MLDRYRKGGVAKIKSVGRKWAVLDSGYRFDIRDKDARVAIDGGNYTSPGYVYDSPLAQQAFEARIKSWQELADAVRAHSYCPPDHLTTDAIREMIEKLRPAT